MVHIAAPPLDLLGVAQRQVLGVLDAGPAQKLRDVPPAMGEADDDAADRDAASARRYGRMDDHGRMFSHVSSVRPARCGRTLGEEPSAQFGQAPQGRARTA